MKTLDEKIVFFLLQHPLYRDVVTKTGKLRVDTFEKEEILSLYKLRLELALEKTNKESIELCSDVIRKVSEMSGNILYSICYMNEDVKIIGLVDEFINTIYEFPS